METASPYWVSPDGRHALHLGDCRRLLAGMADASVDHTITDPPYDERTHAGSGTTGVACIQTGRRFIECELDERYAEHAVRRMETALREQREQPVLFDQPQRGRTVQPALF